MRTKHTEQDEVPETLERPDLALGVAPRWPDSVVATVTSTAHPTLPGRVRCAMEGREESRWLPALQGLSIRPGDRVLVMRAEGFAEHLVVGVVDGLAPRARPLSEAGPRLAMLPDEALRIETAAGTPLIEVRSGETGPVVRLLSRDLAIETEGHLRISAATLELEARRGGVRVDASDDVVVAGETIHLN